MFTKFSVPLTDVLKSSKQHLYDAKLFLKTLLNERLLSGNKIKNEVIIHIDLLT